MIFVIVLIADFLYSELSQIRLNHSLFLSEHFHTHNMDTYMLQLNIWLEATFWTSPLHWLSFLCPTFQFLIFPLHVQVALQFLNLSLAPSSSEWSSWSEPSHSQSRHWSISSPQFTHKSETWNRTRCFHTWDMCKYFLLYFSHEFHSSHFFPSQDISFRYDLPRNHC